MGQAVSQVRFESQATHWALWPCADHLTSLTLSCLSKGHNTYVLGLHWALNEQVQGRKFGFC